MIKYIPVAIFSQHPFSLKILSAILFIVFTSGNNLDAQNGAVKPSRQEDSLNILFNKAKHDTTRAALYVEISKELGGRNVDTIKVLCEKGLQLLAKLPASEKNTLTVKRTEGTLLNNVGYVYHTKNDILKALEYYHKSETIQEEIGDKAGLATSLINTGIIYSSLGDLKKAEQSFSRSLKLREELRDKVGIGESLNNLGGLFYMQGDLPTALKYFQRSLNFREQTGNKEGIANSLNNIASIYDKQGYTQKAFEYCQKSLKIIEESGNKWGITHALNSMGGIMLKLKKYKEAEQYSSRALQMAREIGFPVKIQNSAETLYKIYKAQNKTEKALAMHELYTQMKDTINNKENEKAAVKKQMGYEYEKKEAIESARQEATEELHKAALASQTMQRNGFIGGFALMIALASVSYRGYRSKRKAHAAIEKQKVLVEEKHKEITDSINYAERIQRSFLATSEMLDLNLKDYFVFFKPKDIVSGDFYWAATLNNGNFVLAVGDSTGHGVPGAIMSLLNITSLEKAVERDTNPAEILNHTRSTIIERLRNDGSTGGGKDGMDCSILIFDTGKKQLHLASSNNSVWIIREKELIEIKGDKMPVGKNDRDAESFAAHFVDLKSGDCIYALSDGYTDQFGGPQGKKFKSKQMKDLLLANAHLSMTQQKELLENTFNKWKGNLEQVDDVCVIGIKV